jgi:hypothetical protein
LTDKNIIFPEMNHHPGDLAIPASSNAKALLIEG